MNLSADMKCFAEPNDSLDAEPIQTADKKGDWNSLLLSGCNFSPGQKKTCEKSIILLNTRE